MFSYLWVHYPGEWIGRNLMYRLVTTDLHGRDVLIVEDDQQTAETIWSSIDGSGGRVVGVVPTVEEAARTVGTMPADLVFMHTRFVSEHDVPLSEIFRPLGVEVAFMACHDDWFDWSAGNDESQAQRAPSYRR